MAVENNLPSAASSAQRKPYVVCFVGLDEDFETLLVDLIPDAQVLSFATPPGLTEKEIDSAASGLLSKLYYGHKALTQQGKTWDAIALVGHGVGGIVMKQAMIFANADIKYQELALLVSDLIFFETPHRIGGESTWPTVLASVTRLNIELLRGSSLTHVNAISECFLRTAKRYHIVNILASKSPLKSGDFDCRVLDYAFEKNLELKGSLTAVDMRDRLEDLESVHRHLAEPHMMRSGLRFRVQDYLAFLSKLSWSWRPMGDYGLGETVKSMTHQDIEHAELDSPSSFIQLVGPPGCAKRTLLRHLASTRDKKPENTVVILIKEDFRSLDALDLDILKAFICQVLWRRPFFFPRVKSCLETFTNSDGWTKSSLWIIVRILCESCRPGELTLYVGDIGSWFHPLQPLLHFLQSSVHIQPQIISTNARVDLTGLPTSTIVIDVLAHSNWESTVANVIEEMLLTQPGFGHPEVRRKIEKQLQSCDGGYLTALLYLEQVSRLTIIPTPAAIEQNLDRFPRDREQIFHKNMAVVVDSGLEIRRWCSHVLSWLLNACRPLTVRELSMAVAISHAEPGSSATEVGKHIPVKMWEDLDRYLGIFLRKEGQVVLLIHETARTSLLSFASGIEDQAFSLLDHIALANFCLEYLLIFLPGVSNVPLGAEEENTFLSYTARHWPQHYLLTRHLVDGESVNKGKLELENRIQRLLSSNTLRDRWYRIFRDEVSAQTRTQLEIASELGLSNIAQRILVDRERFDVNEEELQNSLQLAVINGHSDITKSLICNGAKISPSLQFAASDSRLAILQQLIDFKSEPEVLLQVNDVVNALQVASGNGNREALQMLLSYAERIVYFELVPNLPLEEAADRGHPPIVKYLIEKARETIQTMEDEKQVTMTGILEQKATDALHAACNRGDESCVHLLLQEDTKPTVQALETAAELGNSAIVKALLDKHVYSDKDRIKFHSSSALPRAAGNGHKDVVGLLLAAKFPISATCSDRDTALHKAAANGHRGIVEYLINHGAERNMTNQENMTPAELAAKGGHLSTFKIIQEIPQPANYNNYIRLASENGQVLMVRYLLGQNEEPIEGSDESLSSALVAAAYRGYLAVVKELCQAKVEVNRRTGHVSALHQAGSQGHQRIVEYLLSQGADVNATDQMRRTPLHQSVRYPGIVKMMIDNGCNSDATDSDDRTALHLTVIAKDGASQTSHLEESIKELLGAGVDINAKDEDGNTSLHLAAKYAFTWAVSAFLDRSPDLTVTNKSKATVLHLAATSGNDTIVRGLLENGALGLESTNSDGQTPLHLAAKRADSPTVRLLLDKEACMIDTPDNRGKSALLYAAESGNLTCLTDLLAAGADINCRDTSQTTALKAAATLGDLETVRFLLAHGADTEVANEYQTTPLLSATRYNYIDIARALLDKGARVEAVDDTGTTPLNMTTIYGHIDLARLLLDRNADPETADKDKWTPLLSAVSNGFHELVTLLVNHGADLKATNSYGWRALNLAAHHGYSNIVELLLNHGADAESLSDSGKTPLALASANGHYEAVTLLVKHGVNIEAADQFGWRSLNLAAHHGFSNIVELLLNHGADIEGSTNNKWTPLASATARGHYEIATLLVKRGANAESRNTFGWTPFNLAANHGFSNIIQLLWEHGVDINTADNEGSTPLISASAKEHYEIATLLIKQGANMNALTRFGETALHQVARKDYSDIARCLIQHGADINASGADGFTPLHLAIQQCALETTALLVESSASTTCTDMCGKTPLDWLPAHKQEEFFDRIPSFKGYQPTSRNEWDRQTRESLRRIINELEQPNVDEQEFLRQAQMCLCYLGDKLVAARCFLQLATYDSAKKTYEMWGGCDLCLQSMYGHAYICMNCRDTFFCGECMPKHKEEPSVQYCIGHEYLEIRAAQLGSDEVPDPAASLKALVEDLRTKYGTNSENPIPDS